MTKRQVFSSQGWGYKDKVLSVKKHRNRIGCDICKKKSIPTEGFIGYCGNILWICGKCFKKITMKVVR